MGSRKKLGGEAKGVNPMNEKVRWRSEKIMGTKGTKGGRQNDIDAKKVMLTKQRNDDKIGGHGPKRSRLGPSHNRVLWGLNVGRGGGKDGRRTSESNWSQNEREGFFREDQGLNNHNGREDAI